MMKMGNFDINYVVYDTPNHIPCGSHYGRGRIYILLAQAPR